MIRRRAVFGPLQGRIGWMLPAAAFVPCMERFLLFPSARMLATASFDVHSGDCGTGMHQFAARMRASL
ncbi:hypothetical protein AC240_10090 [Ralstonia sp. MD27]|nr:hypothetical protein AC240_10090 [Ralstonia sp. MD27]MBA9955562.1 hypothetical protein [Ralstonia insidiosa]